MHDEVLVRGRVRLLPDEPLVRLLGIRPPRLAVELHLRGLSGPRPCDARVRFAARCPRRRYGGRRSLKGPLCAGGEGRLARPAGARWHLVPRSGGTLHSSGRARCRRLATCASRGRAHVQRDDRVARQIAPSGRLLREDLADQLWLGAEGAIEARAQAGASHGLGGLCGRLPHVVADHQACGRTAGSTAPS
jgi:hypothetical protein